MRLALKLWKNSFQTKKNVRGYWIKEELSSSSLAQKKKKKADFLFRLRSVAVDMLLLEAENFSKVEPNDTSFLDKLQDKSIEMLLDYEGMEKQREVSDLVNQLRDITIDMLLYAQRSPKPHNLFFWKEWDDQADLLVNQSWGPKNAMEEQIEWTKQGKMWPYPINNEYMLGPEQKVSFAQHVFLEPQWEKHGVPRSKSVDHFMELVMVGLSKNPYMSAEKKREHIEWFAKYFKAEMAGKYKGML